MDENNQRGFLATATSMGQTAYDVTKTVGHAMAGDFVGAAASAARNPLFRKLVSFVCAFVIFLIIVICSLPTMLLNALTGGEYGEYTEAQFRILNMASQINGLFLDEYNMELEGLVDLGISEDDITTDEPVPPISPYKIMAYFCAASLDGEADADVTIEDVVGDEEEVITGGIRIGTSLLPDTVERYRTDVEAAAMRYGISGYVDVLMAMMAQESGGRGNDVMQSAGSGYVHGAVTPESSIDGGVHYFAKCLEKANCTDPQDWAKLEVAVQAYNFGTGYINWLINRGYSGWTATNAAAYSDYMLQRYQENGSNITRYGDKQYIQHVFRYYHKSGSSNNPVDKIDIVHLLAMLREFEGEYYYHKHRRSEYEILFITNHDTDFFVDTVFHLTDAQLAAASSYEAVFEQLGNTEFGSFGNILGQASNLDSLPLTNAQVTRYLAIARATDPAISSARSQVLTVGLSLVGKVEYFWGGKYYGTGWNSEWGTLKKVTAAGDRTSGTYQPFGLDCSGFVDWAYRTAGVSDKLKAGGTWYQYNNTTPITAAQLQPGDLGFMLSGGRTTHVGIYVGKDSSGNRLWVHSQGGEGVVVGTCGFTHFREVVS